MNRVFIVAAGTIPVLEAADTEASLGFERPPDDRSSRLLPPEHREGDHQASIPIDDIRRRGAPRDGIPSIDSGVAS